MGTGNLSAVLRRLTVVKALVLFVAVVLLAGACGDGQVVTVAGPTASTVATPNPELGQLAALREARMLWQAGAPSDYTVTESCDDCSGVRKLAVRGDDVISLSVEGDQTSVDDLFDRIELAIQSGGVVAVNYDELLGFPVMVKIDGDGDGELEVDVDYRDLQAMPIVRSLEELQASHTKWNQLGIDDYVYLFRAECTCDDGGISEVEVRDGTIQSVRALDDAGRSSTLSPGTIEEAFVDLKAWFTDSSELVAEGLLDVDVRMDPELGYPRWFRVVGEDIDDAAFAGRFEIVVTIDLIGSRPEPVEPPDHMAEDRAQYEQARARWIATALSDYRYQIVYHCECPTESRGPFQIVVRNGDFWSAAAAEGFGGAADPDVLLIEQVFDLISAAVEDGIDVDVTYDEATGQPLDVIIDTEAVAVDGGRAFTISPAVRTDQLGFMTILATAGPQCPVQRIPPDPDCEDVPVANADVVVSQPGQRGVTTLRTDENGRASVALEPGLWTVTPQPVDGLLGTAAPVEVFVESNQVVELDLGYDTGIR